MANRRSTNRLIHRNEGMEEQYEGGRLGNRREEREYGETDDNYRRDDDMETGKLATKLVQNELKRRAAVGIPTSSILSLSHHCSVFFRLWKVNQKCGQLQVLIVH